MRIDNHKSNFIDYSQPLSFIFNNKSYKGYQGDTLASALIANNVRFLQEALSTGESED